jgi:hypothetical protein
MSATPTVHTLAEQLVFSHQAYASWQKFRMLSDFGAATQAQVDEAKDFARTTKRDLLAMLGVDEAEVRDAHRRLMA